jgi:hypothetical protein
MGIGDEGMGISSGRGGSATIVVRSGKSGPEPTLADDLRILDAHAVGKGSLKEKAQANLAAIRTLKRIEAENRPATAEEKAILVKDTGWGAMPGAFEPQLSREWQKTLRGLADDLDKRGQRLLAQDLRDFTVRAVGDVGTEFRCNAVQP